MWSALFEFVVLVLAAGFVWRFIARMLTGRSQPTEPEIDQEDYPGVPAWIRPRPKPGAGAVAVAEPDS